MAIVNANGKSYDSGDVTIGILGGIPNEAHEITYKTEQEHQLNHGVNYEASSWSQGKKTHSCTLTLNMADVAAIEDAIGGKDKDLLKIKPFEIQVGYLNEYNKQVLDIIRCKFMDTGRTVDGGMNLKQQFNMFVLGIRYNVT